MACYIHRASSLRFTQLMSTSLICTTCLSQANRVSGEVVLISNGSTLQPVHCVRAEHIVSAIVKMFYSTLIHNYTSDNMLRTVFMPQCSAYDLVYHLFDVYVG